VETGASEIRPHTQIHDVNIWESPRPSHAQICHRLAGRAGTYLPGPRLSLSPFSNDRHPRLVQQVRWRTTGRRLPVLPPFIQQWPPTSPSVPGDETGNELLHASLSSHPLIMQWQPAPLGHLMPKLWMKTISTDGDRIWAWCGQGDSQIGHDGILYSSQLRCLSPKSGKIQALHRRKVAISTFCIRIVWAAPTYPISAKKVLFARVNR
jgi:hypothetical protein